MWKKADLHHHTFCDIKTRKKGLADYQNIIDILNKNEVNLIAITDHDKISFESIDKYKEYILQKNYEIEVLPGIELGFSFTKNKIESKGDLILIFNPSQIQILREQSKYIFEEYKKHCLFETNFQIIVDRLKKEKINFISMPHFNKGSKNIDYKSFDKEYIERIENGYGQTISTGIEKMNLMGTDAHDINDFKEKIINISWLYNIKNFYELKKLSTYGSNRIRFGDKPSITKKIIKSIIYKEKNGEKIELKLSRGLNTIIGRRGTGKTFLLNKIHLLSNDNSFTINKSKSLEFNDVKYLKQNDLAKSIESSLHVLYSNNMNSISFEKIDVDFKKAHKEIKKIRDKKNKLINAFHSLYKANLDTINNNKALTINKQIIKNINNFIEIIETNKNVKEIALLNKDYDLISNLNIDDNSTWLKVEINIIKKKINNFKQNPKYSSYKNKNIVEVLKLVINSIKETEKGNISVVIVLKPREILESIKTMNEIQKNLQVLFQTFIDQYWKYHSNYQYFSNEIEKENGIIIKLVFKLKKEITYKKYIYEILRKKFNNVNNSIKSINDLILLKEKEKFYNENNIFDIKNHYYIENERIDDKSIGTQHEYLVNKSLGEDKEVFILDQPDDDLDSITIKEQIISKINKWNFNKQVIIVTHDPKIVINADSQNIILANYNGDKEFGEQTYKNINEEELKKFAHKIIDGVKKYPHIRYKKYGGYDENN